MKVVSTEALTKLIQLVKSAFVKVEDVVETSEVTLADVAISGDYDDLINKPSEVTESTVSGWGFTKNTGTVTSVNNVSPVNGNVTLSIPTVNNPTITITQGGVSKGSFTLNQATGDTIALDAGGSSYSAGDWIDISNDTISAKGDVNTDLIGEIWYGWNYANSGAEILDRNLVYTKSMSTGVYLKIYDASGNEITQIGVIEGIEEDYTYYTVTGLYINSEWQAELYLEDRQDSLLFYRGTDVSRSLDEVLPTQKAVKTYVDNKDSLVVHNTGSETISGTKTFSSSPIVPTVTTSDSSTKAASTAFVKNVLASIYPVGSIYIGTQSTCPMASLISGSTWELVAANKALWTGNGTNANTTIAAGLPNITGAFDIINHNPNNHAYTGAFTKATAGGYPISGVAGGVNWSEGWGYIQENFDASYSNSIYGSSTTVQPPAYVVNVWRRTA